VSEELSWTLEKLKEGRTAKVGYHSTFRVVGISEIDRKNKTI